MNARSQRMCIWATALGFAALTASFLVASWLPFPSPNRSAASVGRYYMDHTDSIRLCAILLGLGAALLAPLAAVLAVQLKRIEGEFSPMAYLELGTGCASALAITVPAFFWEAAAFRPERDPVVTQSWHDAGWLCLTATVFIFIVQAFATAIPILSDESEDPIFPRWLGYMAIWVSLLLLPSVLCLWFKRGPFAWSGALSLWLAFIAVGVYFTTLVVMLLRAVKRQEASG